MIYRRVYRFKLEPTPTQTQKLYQQAGSRRFVYNWALARRKEHYEATKQGLRYAEQNKELTQLKKQQALLWLKDADSQALQEGLRDLDKAFQNFFAKRGRFPKFQSRSKGHFSFRIPQRVRVAGCPRSGRRKAYCPKIGWIGIRQSQDVEGATKSATFKRNACGEWFVTLTSEFEMPDTALPAPKKPIGLDMGLGDFATLSNGEAVAAPKFYRKAAKKLARAQRELSRAVKGSERRAKAKLRVAKVHRKIANSRADFLHKLTTGLVGEFDHIGLEDLNIKALVKTKLRGHSKSWCDAAMGEFVRQLTYKAQWNRVHLVKVNRFFASSKLCGACGAVNGALTLSDRVWQCECGKEHKRDVSAAQNVLRESLAIGQMERLNAPGATVRPATAGALL